MKRQYFVYIMASSTGTLYAGVTSNLEKRIWEHKEGIIDGFTKKYKCNKLVYFEGYNNINEAIAREKEIKGWKRYKKEALIRSINPHWKDLSEDFNEDSCHSERSEKPLKRGERS